MNFTGLWRGVSGALVAVVHLLGGMRVAVVGANMAPALQAGDHLLVSRLAYRLAPPRRGDLVFLRSGPRAGGDAVDPECIKRIVGLPHERIGVRAGAITIDGHLLHEPYLMAVAGRPAAEGGHAGPAMTTAVEWALGPDQYFVLGDNRAWSTDSRSFGPVPRRAIVGRAWRRYAPAGRQGRVG